MILPCQRGLINRVGELAKKEYLILVIDFIFNFMRLK